MYVLLDIANDHGWRGYGARIGIWHTMDALDRHGLKATVPLTRAAVEQYPQLVQAGEARGWAWLASEHDAVDLARLAARPDIWLTTSDDIAESQLTDTPTCMLIHCRA